MRALEPRAAARHTVGVVSHDAPTLSRKCRIIDFGLSKLTVPGEELKLKCGTLSYVAPEVLSLQGYGIEADMWSIGVIMFLLLRGKLPFTGRSAAEVIERTIAARLPLRDSVWELCSPSVRELVSRLMERDPAKRITAEEALCHPWMLAGEKGETVHSKASCSPVRAS